MTIQEAIRSGKRFRHKRWKEFTSYGSGKMIVCEMRDLLSDDFELEIEEEKLAITKATLSEVLKLSMAQCSPYSPECIPSANFMDQLFKNLGFKD